MNYDQSLDVLVLETLDLSDGKWMASSTIYGTQRPYTAFGRLEMIVSADEAFIVAKCGNQILCILDASTGRSIEIEDWNDYRYTEYCYRTCWVVPEPESSDFLETCWREDQIEAIYYYTYDAQIRKYTRESVMVCSRNSLGACGGVDYRRRYVMLAAQMPSSTSVTMHDICYSSTSRENTKW